MTTLILKLTQPQLLTLLTKQLATKTILNTHDPITYDDTGGYVHTKIRTENI